MTDIDIEMVAYGALQNMQLLAGCAGERLTPALDMLYEITAISRALCGREAAERVFQPVQMPVDINDAVQFPEIAAALEYAGWLA